MVENSLESLWLDMTENKHYNAIAVVAIAESPTPASALCDGFLKSIPLVESKHSSAAKSDTYEMATSAICKCRQKSTEMPRSTFCTV